MRFCCWCLGLLRLSCSWLRDLGDALADEGERAGLERGRLGELVEAGFAAGEADRVARVGGELGEQALERVAAVALRRAAGLRLAGRGRGAGRLCDRIGAC